MEYAEFAKKLLSQLKYDDEDSINTILNNNKLIQEYLQNSEKPIHIKSLVNDINDIILNKQKGFDIIEKVLTTPSMECVYSEFVNSNVMILACKKSNTNAIKWLLKVNINPSVKDENGMTALMYAAENDLIYIIPQLIQEGDYINFVDKNKENALFHAVNNPNSFKELIKSNIDVNIQNEQKDTILLYCCKNDLDTNVSYLVSRSDLDYNIIDKEGKTALMYLLDHDYYYLFSGALNQIRKNNNKYNINYRNKLTGESILTIFMKKYYEMYCKKTYVRKNKDDIYIITCIGMAYAAIISCPGCDINAPIDEDGSTPIMIFLMLNDYIMVDFTFSYCKDINLGIKNKKGINASVLAMNLREEDYLIKVMMQHKTFDTSFVDEHNNNLLMYSVFFRNEYTFLKIVNENEYEKMVIHVNDKNEDAIILGTKLGIFDHVNSYSIRNANVNQQDYLGNSALFYAVKLKNKYDINLLSYCQADPNLKNNQGMSPMDLAKQLGEDDLIKIMNKPKPIHKMKKKLESSKKKNSDEKIEKYIKNYQINNFYEDYKEFVERALTYTAEPLPIGAVKQLAVTLYICLNKCFYHMIRSVDPRTEYDERKKYYYNKPSLHVLDDTLRYLMNTEKDEFENYILHSYETVIPTPFIFL